MVDMPCASLHVPPKSVWRVLHCSHLFSPHLFSAFLLIFPAFVRAWCNSNPNGLCARVCVLTVVQFALRRVPCAVYCNMASIASTDTASSPTGQRVTLSATQAAGSNATNPAAAEVVCFSLFPERVVMLRSSGDASPGWNDVVGHDRHRKDARS